MVSLPEQLLLLALNDKGSVVSSAGIALPYGLAGAVLMELTLRGHLGDDGGKLVVRDPSSTEDDILDEALGHIRASKKARPPRAWVGKLSRSIKHLQARLLARLVDAGILLRQERRILWLFRGDRYPPCDDQVELAIRRRLHQIVADSAEPDLEMVVLISLVDACKLVNEVFGPTERKHAARRVKEIAESEPIGKAVSESVAAIQAAITGSIMATTAASTISTR